MQYITTYAITPFDLSNSFAAKIQINGVEYEFDFIKGANKAVKSLTQGEVAAATGFNDYNRGIEYLFERHGAALGCRGSIDAFLQKNIFVAVIKVYLTATSLPQQSGVLVKGDTPNSKEEIYARIQRILKDLKISTAKPPNSVKTALQVTNFYFTPKIGDLSKLLSSSEEVAMQLQLGDVAVVKSTATGLVSFQVPNPRRCFLGFDEANLAKDRLLPIYVGLTTEGVHKTIDLAEAPHLLVTGQTGGGKSVFLNSTIASLLAGTKGEGIELVLIDPKRVEFGQFKGLKQLVSFNDVPPIPSSAAHIEQALRALVDVMNARTSTLEEAGCKNIADYLQKGFKMQRLVTIIDEAGEIFLEAVRLGLDTESLLIQLVQKSRALGMHFIVCMQNPNARMLSTLVRAQFPTLITFRVNNRDTSNLVTKDKEVKAHLLLNKGDCYLIEGGEATRCQAPMVDDAYMAALTARNSAAKKFKQESLFS